MKKLSTYLFLIFFSFQALSLADDISDFEIEGMSIGDSLLDYFSELEIKNSKVKTEYKNKKFAKYMLVSPSFKNYQVVRVYALEEDKTYKVFAISGLMQFSNRINECYKKQKEIDNDIANLFNNSQVTRSVKEKVKYRGDKSGKSFFKNIKYQFTTFDAIQINCYDFSKKLKKEGSKDYLSVYMASEDYRTWLIEKAWK